MSSNAAPSPSGPFTIAFDYVKSQIHAPGYGYDARPDTPLTGIVLHSTEHAPGQTFDAVCAYLCNSPDVSAHYVVAPGGEIQRILDPGPWRAFHAGYSLYPRPPAVGLRDWNDFAVGIEIYHRQGGAPYTATQYAALTWLVRQLLADHPTIERDRIVTHRVIACNPYEEQPPVEYGRKVDPTDWKDTDFRAWVLTL